jgi:hypothetical protein
MLVLSLKAVDVKDIFLLIQGAKTKTGNIGGFLSIHHKNVADML